MAMRDPPISCKTGRVSEGGKFVDERRWNGEGQGESARLSSDVPHCSMAIKEAGGVMEGRKLGKMDAGEAKERQGLPEEETKGTQMQVQGARGNSKGWMLPKNQPGGAQMCSL